MTTLKQIDAKLRVISTTGDKLNALVHEAAVMIAAHAKEHGDCTRALALVFAMPASVRRQKVIDWFALYTPIRVIPKNDKVGMLKETAKGYTPFDLEAGGETPWFKLAELDPEEKLYDFDALVKMVERLAKQIVKKVEDGKVPAEDVKSAEAIASQISHLKLVRVNDNPVPAAKAENKVANKAR